IELRFPVAPCARIFRLLHPAALVETEDVHLGLGQRPGDRRAGGAGADDEDVNGVVHSKSVPFRHSGAMRSIELWSALALRRISRFRVWSFGPSRNDAFQFTILTGRARIPRMKFE